MGSDALIIGGTPAGTQAALDLADSGIFVHLITSKPFLGAAAPGSHNDLFYRHRLLGIAKHPNIKLWPLTSVDSAKGQSGFFQISLCQAPRYVHTDKCTACGDCVEACPVTVSDTRTKAITLSDGGQPGCAVIDKRGTAPCAEACPGGIPVQGYVALVAQGRFQEALALIEAAIPFPGICGRVCTHPCEINCRRGEVDEPVAIRLLKRYVSDLANGASGRKPSETVPVPSNGMRVAVVGSGPAGMTVAHRLAKQGYRVSIFEKLPVIAGMMGIGIPAYRLPREVIRREYRRIQALGVEIHLNTSIGADGRYSVDDLFEMGYRAVCLTVGAHKSLKLHIPGETLSNVVQGIDLLKTLSISQQLDDPVLKDRLSRMLVLGSDTRALVLGGGNTALDAARCLKRLGLKQVRILYRRSRKEMPALPEEIEEAEHEGVIIQYLTAPVRIGGDETSGVTGLECVRMKLTDPDESGRQRPVPIAGSEFLVEADLVIPAIGQVPDIGTLVDDTTIKIDSSGRIEIQKNGFMTDRPGLFAAGDAVTRDKMAVIEAIGMGKKAAAQIDAFIKGHEPVDIQTTPLPVVPRDLAASEKKTIPRVPVPTTPVTERLGGFSEVEQGYTEAEAIAEARRCLSCGPCSECMACAGVCKPGAVDHSLGESISVVSTGAVIYAGAPEKFSYGPLSNLNGLIRIPPEKSLDGSAAAARAMFDIYTLPVPIPADAFSDIYEPVPRIGLFVCRCGEAISNIIDTRSLCDRAVQWPDVIHAEEISVSCAPEAVETIGAAVKKHDLNRAVVAACACCSIDQACYSCTFQRIRCRQNLGVMRNGPVRAGDVPDPTPLPTEAFSFVNIREQCAWPHKDDPVAATSKATALIAAAVAGANTAIQRAEPMPLQKLSAMVIGADKAATICLKTLNGQGIAASHLPEPPEQIRHAGGRYIAEKNGQTVEAAGVLLVPEDTDETTRLLAAVGLGGENLNLHAAPVGTVMVKPGILLCKPGPDAERSGQAAAAQMTAWFGRVADGNGKTAAVVDPDRCRGCNTCVEICDIGAPEILSPLEHRAWIDPAICTGCGTCAARCPSNAIRSSLPADDRLEAIIEAVLS